MTVVVAGHLCVDLVPSLPGAADVAPGRLVETGPLTARLGGCVANTGRALRALGVEARWAASIGDDPLATFVASLVDDEEVDAELAVEAGRATSYSVVVEPPGVDRTFWHHPGANDVFDGSAVRLDGARMLHVGYPSLLAALRADAGFALRLLFSRAQDEGITTSLDLAVVDPASAAGRYDWSMFLDDVLPVTDIVSPSADDLRSIAPRVDGAWARASAAELATALVHRGAAVAVVSDGAHGLTLATGDAARLARSGAAFDRREAWVAASATVAAVTPDRIVTTNGAGDAATAGLLSGILDDLPPAEALERAATTAARSIAGQLG